MKRVFIVDDQAAVTRVLRLGIEGAGFDVDSSANGAECLVKLGDGHPDFLVTDIDMPRMNGKELCLAIDSQFPERTFPIVVLTSRTELEHRDWTRDIDNLTFMEKPVSIRKLVAHISQCLKASDAAAGA
ncbi:MAG: response regulator [Woeseiaceae bacterium]